MFSPQKTSNARPTPFNPGLRIFPNDCAATQWQTRRNPPPIEYSSLCLDSPSPRKTSCLSPGANKMTENFEPPKANVSANGLETKLGQPEGLGTNLVQTDGQGDIVNPATTDPSGKLLEGSGAMAVPPEKLPEGAKAAPGAAVAEVQQDSGFGLTEAALLTGAAYIAGGLGRKYGINQQILSAVGRNIETLKTSATGVANLGTYARFAQRNIDTLGEGTAQRLGGSLRLGGERIDAFGKVVMGRDGTLVTTAERFPLSPINAIDRYGNGAQFLRSDLGVHSIASVTGRGPIRGFDIKYEANTALGGPLETSIRDGNRFAKFMAGRVIEGKGQFSEAEMAAAIRQGALATEDLYRSVLKAQV